MRDYEELVRALRNEDNCNVLDYIDDAADAIEELQSYADLYKELTEKGQTVARKLIDAYPKWISVEERLPDKDADVLIYGEWIGASGTKHREIYLTNIKEFRYHGYKPIAWMPLPEPPKEDDE